MRLSIKYKILILVSVLAVTSLGVFAYISLNDFKKDKTAYIFAQQRLLSASIAQQIRTIINTDVAFFTDWLVRNRPAVINEKIEEYPNSLLGLASLSIGSSEAVKIKNYFLKSEKLNEMMTEAFNEPLEPKDQFSLYFSPTHVTSYALIIALDKKSKLVALLDSRNLQAIVKSTSESQQTLLFKNKIIFSSNNLTKDSPITGPLQSHFTNSTAVSGSKILTDLNGQKYLMSFSGTGVSNVNVATTISEDEAFVALRIMLKKVILTIIAIFSAAFIISIISSRKLTSALRELYNSTKKIGDGDFDVNIKIDSGDEIEGLANGFNEMAKEVKTLIDKTVETARMEGELKTATMVQETLFPKLSAKFQQIEIVGFNEMASECGGDLCYYYEKDEYLYVMIGDALGHGVGAALVTSAARAACSIAEKMNIISPAQILKILNLAIFETCKTKMWMSFFICRINRSNGEVLYSSAGHPTPYIFSKSNLDKGTNGVKVLADSVGPMLGNSPEFEFKEFKESIEEGDVLLLYTDGLIELKNPELKEWGDMKLVKSTIKALAKSANLVEIKENIYDSLNKFRKNQLPDDDITFILCQFDKKDMSETPH